MLLVESAADLVLGPSGISRVRRVGSEAGWWQARACRLAAYFGEP